MIRLLSVLSSLFDRGSNPAFGRVGAGANPTGYSLGSAALATLFLRGLRNALQRALARRGFRAAQIRQRDHADQAFLPVEHGQTAYLMVCHHFCGPAYVVVFEAITDTLRHHVADGRV